MASRPVAYYIDADLLGLAKVLAGIREDITYPGDPGGDVRRRYRPACPITTPATPDEAWLPLVARLGWSVITRDARISRRPAELEAVRQNGAKVFALDGREATNLWTQLEIVMSQWRRIEERAMDAGPFVVSVTRSRLRDIL